MARIRYTILHWGNKYDGPNTYKDGRQGAAPDAFWDEDEPVDYVRTKRRKKPKRVKTRPGCPGNDYKAHVYVYTSEYMDERDLFYRYFKFHKYENRMCCGCTKRDGSRLSERYVKKFKTNARWSQAEMRNEGYRKYRSDYIAKHGFTRAVYSNFW